MFIVLLLLFIDLPEEVKEKWGNFVTGTLGETNKRNTVELVSGKFN